MTRRVYKHLAAALVSISIALMCSTAAAYPAQSHPFAPTGGWGAMDLQIAHEYWGVDHAPDCTTESTYFDWAFPLGPNGEERNGYATEPTEPGTDCVMHIWSSIGIMRECTTAVHEFGHWLGFGHSDDPHNVMYPEVLWTNVPGRCRDLYKLGHPHATFVEIKIAYFNQEPVGGFSLGG